MFERIKHMLIKEFIQIFRDPKMKGIIFVMPMIQILLFGYVVTTDVKEIALGIYDLDQSPSSRELISKFTGSGYFRLVEHINRENRLTELIDQGQAQAILRLNKGFEKNILSGKQGLVQVILDGTDSNTTGIVLNYTAKITSQFSEKILISRYNRTTGTYLKPGLVEMESRAWFNENLESRHFYVPGVIGILITLITLMLTSMAVVREKEIGTMEQIMVTPITPMEFILGKTIPFALISYIDVIIVTLVGVFWFGVPIRGYLPLLLLATTLYLFTTLGVGLLISTVSQTQQQAMMSTFFFFLPAMLLSGFMFPIANMPKIIQWLTLLNPLRYYLVIIRGIFLKGVGFSILWPQMAALAIMGFITLGLSVKRFHKTLN